MHSCVHKHIFAIQKDCNYTWHVWNTTDDHCIAHTISFTSWYCNTVTAHCLNHHSTSCLVSQPIRFRVSTVCHHVDSRPRDNPSLGALRPGRFIVWIPDSQHTILTWSIKLGTTIVTVVAWDSEEYIVIQINCFSNFKSEMIIKMWCTFQTWLEMSISVDLLI